MAVPKDEIEFPGSDRKFGDVTLKLGKKINPFKKNDTLKRQLFIRGMKNIDLIAQWAKIIGKVYADHSIPTSIKIIAGVKTLVCKVRYTRILEFQYQKETFIKQINIYAGQHVIQDIRFIRSENIPQKRIYNTLIDKETNKEKHPKLEHLSQKLEKPKLYETFNMLAHLVMPIIAKPQTSDQLNNAQKTIPSSKLLTSWRERAKILLNSCQK